MDYKLLLSQPLSKNFLDVIVQNVVENPTDFYVIYPLIFDSDSTIAWRAAWACTKLSEKHPEWFSEQQVQEIMDFALVVSNASVLRGCLAITLNLSKPKSISVDFINACFDWMISTKVPIAVQALSMKLLFDICKEQPDFKSELKLYLDNVDVSCFSVGYNSTRRNILKKLKVS